MKETWALIEGTSKYEVSNFGQVRNATTKRILKPATGRGGYLWIVLYFKPCVQTPKYIHRLVACAFIANKENKKEVNHKNGIKDDNSVTNLEWMTPSENAKHAFASGLKNNVCKLSSFDVTEIRKIYKSGGISHQKIGESFGVTASAVGLIIRGQRWPQLN